MENTLFYGDNLDILRQHVETGSVDLVYLDPPFNSNRSYNVLFKDESGRDSESQITAFEDTWHWNEAAQLTYEELLTDAPPHVGKMIAALRDFIGSNQMMAYLVMMTARLIELHRVLKPTGSLYLHCDPSASHYLKIVLDTIFGGQNFRNDIVWKRTSSHNDSKRWMHVHDVILFYSRDKSVWNPVFLGHNPDYVSRFYRFNDDIGQYRLDHIIRSASMGLRPNLSYEYKGYTPQWGWRVIREKLEKLDNEGRIEWSRSGRPYLRRYLHEQEGMPISSVIVDIPPIGAQAAERLGYPTQKPVALLKRIIEASSNEGDIVLDPFCGCGTAIAAAHELKRRWIGIDITHLAIALQKYRLKDAFGLTAGKDYQVVGEPQDIGAARQLAEDDRYQFQWWALSLVRAQPLGGSEGSRKGKKGADRGVDGVITFLDEANRKPKQVLVQVKSGHVGSRDIRDLHGTVEREDAAIGALITLEAPTSPMTTEAVSAGFYDSPTWNSQHPRLQILTVEELLRGAQIDYPAPSQTNRSFKRAERVRQKASGTQSNLF